MGHRRSSIISGAGTAPPPVARTRPADHGERQSLAKKVQRHELTEDEARVTAGLLRGADIALFPKAGLIEPATRLALVLAHSAYDCFYLALAEQNECAFVTADEAFARKVGVGRIPVAVALLHDVGPD